MKKNIFKEKSTMVVKLDAKQYVVIAHCADADVRIGGIFEDINDALKARDEHLELCEDVEVKVYLARLGLDNFGEFRVELFPVA